MGRVINIANKLDREPRFLIVDETHKYKVDCTKNAVTKVMALEGTDKDQIDEIITILLGKEAFKEIEKMDLPYDNWVIIMKGAIAVAVNKDLDDVEEDFREETKSE